MVRAKMVKLHIQVLKRLLKLSDNEILRGADGETYYTAKREGDYIILKEDAKQPSLFLRKE